MIRVSVRGWLIAVAAICLLLVPLSGLIGVARFALASEEHLLAAFHAFEATQSYVEQQPGKWPQSWTELAPYLRSGIDVDWVSENVEFDFAADPADLARQSCDTFTGIRPHEPCFENYQLYLERLLETLRQQHPEAAEWQREQ